MVICTKKEEPIALHIQDKEADRLLREFARQRGIGLTAALKVAVTEASAHAGAQRRREPGTLAERIRPIIEEIRDLRAGIEPVDQKAFMDEMWGEND